MTDQSVPEKKSRNSIAILLAALAVSAALGAGSYLFVNNSDISITGKDESAQSKESAKAPAKAIEYLPLDPVFVTLARTDPPRSLRFEATLELHRGAATDVGQQMPRLIDLTNTYLRATEFADLREPAALMTIRAQLLRRYETVVGEDKIRNLLVTKFLID